MVVIAGAHGLWLLPAILSLVGGSKQSPESAASVMASYKSVFSWGMLGNYMETEGIWKYNEIYGNYKEY